MERKAVVSLLPLVCGLMVLAVQGHAAESADPRQANLVEWASGESAERLSRSSHKTDFFALSNHFISQDNSIFCGPVSSAIVLNALRLGKREGLPRDRRSIAQDEMAWLPQGADPFYEKYTPNNVLNAETKTRLEVLGKPILIHGEPKSDFGLQLRQLAQVLRSHGVRVVARVVDESADATAVRRELAANLATGDDFRAGQLCAPEPGSDGRRSHLPARGVRRTQRFVPDHGCEPQPGTLGLGQVR